MGRLLCPKPLFFNYFQGISNFQEKWGTPRKRAPVYPLFPFVDPLFPVNLPDPYLHLVANGCGGMDREG